MPGLEQLQTLPLVLGRLGDCRISTLIGRPLYSEQVEDGRGDHRRDQCHDDQHREESGREYVSVVNNVHGHRKRLRRNGSHGALIILWPPEQELGLTA